MNRPLLLVGAGGLAREVLAAARALPELWKPIGMVDDAPERHGSEVDGLLVLGPTALVHDHPDAAVLVCVARSTRPAGRRTLVGKLGLPADRYATLIHPAASIAPGVTFGEGTVLLAGAVVTAPQHVGAHVIVMPMVLFTHDDAVGDFSTFAGRATLSGNVTIGEAAYLGAGSMVREGVRVGAEAVIGMGAAVLSDVPDGETWVGVPAKRLDRSS
ncbi:Acetyltransferase [Alloactinosynnema sp. L-07]|uniref:acetyltransferase n=1 Tax=Alloactinosynnema sp. L-07 TaxID=1653480 RepID=UPI00065EFAD7|nr:acetyltransferase [Alloactinosynnema sp. L-07]CRK60330.1 Acetyltransferase [Alloactinosynnema sp. L-07]